MLVANSLHPPEPITTIITLYPYKRTCDSENMKIGIIGSGNIGATLAQLFAKAGHQVEISNSRGPASLNTLVQSIGSDNVSAAVRTP
jgi:lactate dehydrogenase-like 2-hydroxyacid dehydrogenase